MNPIAEVCAFAGLFISIGGVFIHTGKLIGMVLAKLEAMEHSMTDMKTDHKEEIKELHHVIERVAVLEERVG